MHDRKNHPLRLISSLFLAAALSSSASAQDANRVDQLENRMQGLETKMDALIELMTKEQATAPERSQSQDATSSDETVVNGKTAEAPGLRPGVNLDLFPIVLGEEWPATPPGFPVASAVINSKQPFNLDLFQSIGPLRQYANPSEKSLGQFFSGKIFLEESGEYVFQASISRNTRTRFGSSACYAAAIVDGKVIASTTLNLTEGENSTDQAVANLEGGIHSVGIWALCNGDGHSEYMDALLSMKSPSDRTPKPIDTSRFLTDG